MNNALNLFPTTTTAPNAHHKLQQLLYRHSPTCAAPTEIQTTLATPLYDDAVQYLTTLDMNRAASFTFGTHGSYVDLLPGGRGTRGESIAEEMWHLLIDLTLLLPTRHSPLALTKTVSLLKYVLLYGSEACLDDKLLPRIEAAVRPLRELNTALVEQRVVEQILSEDSNQAAGIDGVDAFASHFTQLGTKATATMMKLRGGSVDRGHPLREAAGKLYDIVSNPYNLRQLRHELAQQQQSSLVPVGSTKQVGYITDKGRLRLLQEKVAREENLQKQKARSERLRLQQTRSNLVGKSAVDSFGGGYSGGGGRVVGAANSLEDMIRAARCELDLHKSKQTERVAALTKGYTDNPAVRDCRLAQLEGNVLDPAYKEKEKALQDALEYLEEMQKLEQEKAGDLLEGNLLGDANGNGGGNASMGVNGGGGSGGADLLGFDRTPALSVADGFGGPLNPSTGSGAVGGSEGPADLLGLGGVLPSQTEPATHAIPGYMGGVTNSENNASAGTIRSGIHLRPSLVTGAMSAGDNTSIDVSHHSEGIRERPATTLPHVSPNVTGMEGNTPVVMGGAETSAKMQMAARLFAGVVSSDNAPKKETATKKKPIMAIGNNSTKMAALDDLLSMGETALAPSLPALCHVSAGDTNSDLTFGAKHEAFALGESHANSIGTIAPSVPAPSIAPPAPPLSDLLGAGPMGGSCGKPPAPTMAPPPPPTMDPSQPPPSWPTIALSPALPASTAAAQNNSLSVTFGAGPMGGSSGMPPAPIIQNNSSSDPFGVGLMGGNSIMPPAPTMAPQRLPMMEPPQPPPSLPTAALSPSALPASAAAVQNNRALSGNPSVEQMQEMIKQQQAQMNQMMQMMQQMQGSGGAGTNNNC